jgi:3-oxoacyl-[acyl-carrier protein] reductase
MDLKLTGKIALVTGSSRGIGLATAKAFAAEGCQVMLSGRSTEQLRKAETALRATGAQVAAYAGDVGSPDEASRLIKAAVAAYGGIDILVNNVGGGGGGARIADSTDDDWRGALERNLIQTVRIMRLALPHMKDRPGAAVINVASISGWSPQLAMSGQYGAAKAALIFETERWALEFVPHGIRVNTVSPGSILVEGNGWDRYRLANPAYFVFLASPRGYWINGRNIPVDGLEQPHAPLDHIRNLLGRAESAHRKAMADVIVDRRPY